MNKLDDLAVKIAEHEAAIAELRKERSRSVKDAVAAAYVPDADGNWPLLKDVAKRLGVSIPAVRQAIADQTPADGDDQLLEVIIARRKNWETTYARISKELGISPLRVRDIESRHWQQIAEEQARNRMPTAPTTADPHPLVDLITAEAIRLYRNSQWFLREEEKIWGYDWHIREWQMQSGGLSRIGGSLRIRLPNDYAPAS